MSDEVRASREQSELNPKFKSQPERHGLFEVLGIVTILTAAGVFPASAFYQLTNLNSDAVIQIAGVLILIGIFCDLTLGIVIVVGYMKSPLNWLNRNIDWLKWVVPASIISGIIFWIFVIILALLAA